MKKHRPTSQITKTNIRRVIELGNYMTMKKELKVKILKRIEEIGEADLNKLVALFSLDTGFTEATIKKMLRQMEQLQYIKIDGLVVSIPKAVPPAGPVQ